MTPHRPLIIIPEVIARSVVEEASLYLDHQLPRHWIRQLTHRAYVTLESNAAFRRKIERGNTGRDLLWSFMRHWLCAILAKETPDLHKQLPSDYNVGCPLPPPSNLVDHRSPVGPSRPAGSFTTKPRSFRPHRNNPLRTHGLLPTPL